MPSFSFKQFAFFPLVHFTSSKWQKRYLSLAKVLYETENGDGHAEHEAGNGGWGEQEVVGSRGKHEGERRTAQQAEWKAPQRNDQGFIVDSK